MLFIKVRKRAMTARKTVISQMWRAKLGGCLNLTTNDANGFLEPHLGTTESTENTEVGGVVFEDFCEFCG